MKIKETAKAMRDDLREVTRANRGPAAVSIGVILATVLYTLTAYAQGPGDVLLPVLPDGAAGIDPWVLIAGIMINSLGMVAAAVKSWSAGRSTRAKELQMQVVTLQGELLDEARARAIAEGRLEGLHGEDE